MTDQDLIAAPVIAARIGPAYHAFPPGHDKAPTSRLDGVRHRGVWLESRYRCAAELSGMMAAIDWIHMHGGALVVQAMQSMFCDSKATSAYEIKAPGAEQDSADLIARALSHAFHAINGGHNDITVSGRPGISACEPADWEPLDHGGAA